MKAAILIFVFGLFGCGFGSDDDLDDTDLDYLDDGVNTPSGKIMGKDTEFYGQRVKAYLGIPYAKPPVGSLRFKKPQPLENPPEVLVADTDPPACVQYSEYKFPWYDARGGKSEDCLYLNIWSPRFAPARFRLPVIFFIYGGGFTMGSNRIMSQSGLGLSMIGTSIVVSPNYRVGALGFLSDGTEDAPGNAGMHDLILALKWVQDNIAAFGADTDRITIMGQDTGAVTVSYFLLSPLTQGLFSRAIMQSGSFLAIREDAREHNAKLTRQLADAVGCESTNDNDTIDCLRSVDANVLAKTLASFSPAKATYFLPQYGDDFLPADPTEDLKKGNFHPVPLLIGNTKDEGSFLLTTRYPDHFGVYGRKDPVVDKKEGAEILRNTFAHLPDPEAVVHQYLDDVDDDDNYEIRKQVYTSMGDYSVTCPNVYFAEEYSKGNGTVEYYVFAHRSPDSKWAHWMGVAHYDDIPYVMARPIAGFNYETFMKYYNGELGLSYTMAQIWGDFAKKGQALDFWKNYSSYHHQYVLLQYRTKKKMYGPGPQLDNCNFFRDHYGF